MTCHSISCIGSEFKHSRILTSYPAQLFVALVCVYGEPENEAGRT